jgi:hypothetical protein
MEKELSVFLSRYGAFSVRKPEARATGCKLEAPRLKTPESEGTKSTRTDLLEEVTSWVDQYVMEVNVDPLLKTVDKRVESQVKRSFIQQWSPFNSKTRRSRRHNYEILQDSYSAVPGWEDVWFF